jgi:hypothetical protein
LILLLATPLGFILSLLGVIMNKDRRAGVVGLVLTGALIAYALLASLCS